jgi:hypothetical protein
MKFVKRLNLDRYHPTGHTFEVEADGRIITSSVASIQIPAGTTNQRVQTYTNGMLRYNTTAQELEAYINGTWEFIRTRRQATITVDTLGTGNYVNSIYGPTSYRQDATKTANILVFVENVFQVPTVNYTLVNDPIVTKQTQGVTNPGVTVINITDQTNIIPGMVIGGDLGVSPNTTVLSLSTTTSAVNISSPTIGTIQAGVGLTFAYSTGTYVSFTSAPPMKPVYAISGFDGYFPPFES